MPYKERKEEVFMIDFIHSYGKFIIAGVVAVIILTTVGAAYYYNVLHTAEDDYAPKSLLDDYSYKEYENTNITGIYCWNTDD